MINNYNSRVSTEILTSDREGGFVFVALAFGTSILLGFLILYLNNSIILNINQAEEVYSAEQAYWNAISGIEYAIYNSDNLDEISGTYPLINGSIILSLSFTDQFGSPLSNGEIRVISRGYHSYSVRITEVKFKINDQNVWPEISILLQGGNFQFDQNFTFNDSLYLGGNLVVDSQTPIGDPPGERTHIYVPFGKTVTGDLDANFSWSERSSLNLPTISSTPYDSLISIANSITSTSGNKYKGNLVIDGNILDLSAYSDNTYFIKGKLKIKGGSITGGAIVAPGFIVTTGKITLQKKGNTQTAITDNIIMVTGNKIEIKNATGYGYDYSTLTPASRPKTVNEIYARNDIEISRNSNIWAQVISLGDVTLNGKIHGLLYTTDGLEFDKNTSYLEGALFSLRISKPEDALRKGRMDLNHYFPLHFFSGVRFEVVPYSFKEI